MPRYIDANILMLDIDERGADFWCSSVDISNAKKIVSEQPTADAQKVKHGIWKALKEANRYCVCSVCYGCYFTRKWIASCKWKYCPKCGAKMDLEV